MAYIGHSMSVRAAEAYASGEAPLSKWTKSEIMENVQAYYPDFFEALKRQPVKVLRDFLLVRSSWHHTGKLYRRTDFYSFNEETSAERLAYIAAYKEVTSEPEKVLVIAEWKEFEKRGRRWNIEEFEDLGVMRGNWIHTLNNGRKSANGKALTYRQISEKDARKRFKAAGRSGFAKWFKNI